MSTATQDPAAPQAIVRARDDLAGFLAWLASLPQDAPLPGWQAGDEPLLCWLRAQGATDAALLGTTRDDGWTEYQDYRAFGEEREVPGWAFYDYDEWDPEGPVGAETAKFRARLAEDTEDEVDE